MCLQYTGIQDVVANWLCRCRQTKTDEGRMDDGRMVVEGNTRWENNNGGTTAEEGSKIRKQLSAKRERK